MHLKDLACTHNVNITVEKGGKESDEAEHFCFGCVL